MKHHSLFFFLQALEASDLDPVLSHFREHLISKNVAKEIADKLCDSVSKSLEGKQLGTFNTIKSTVKNALEDSLVRILTPKRNIDVLRDALQAKKDGRPYVIVFVGVNGVGKSTNLAKVKKEREREVKSKQLRRLNWLGVLLFATKWHDLLVDGL
jgi:signal recognition particle receptor subunit alpha